MKKQFILNGYKVVKDENIHYIDDFPEFPNVNKKSKKKFQSIERIILNEKFICFPLKFNLIERVIQLTEDNEEYFSFTGIKNRIEKDKLLFVNTKTFFKIKVSFVDNNTELKIIYYTIDENGLNDCSSMEMMLNIIFIKYNVKQFTPKRVEFLMNVVKLDMEEIRQIPLIPVQWLDYGDDGNLLELKNIKIVDNELNKNTVNPS
jgi:hypothetical protein